MKPKKFEVEPTFFFSPESRNKHAKPLAFDSRALRRAVGHLNVRRRLACVLFRYFDDGTVH